MTAAQTIANARKHLPANPGGYARVLSAAIRSAASDRTANALRMAIAEDGTSGLFVGLDTASPVAT